MRRSTTSIELFPVSGTLHWRRLLGGVALALVSTLIFGFTQAIAQDKSGEAESEAAEPETPAEDEGASGKGDPAAEPEMPAEEQPQPEAAEPAAEGGQPAAEGPVPAPVEPPSEEPEAEASTPELPEGYKPPGVRPKEMTLTKELMTQEEEAALGKELKAARADTVLRDGQLDATSTELIKKLAKYYVYRLTMKKYLQERVLHERREDLMRQVHAAASIVPALPQQDAFRTVFLQEIVDRTSELLEGNAWVRLNAALVLSGLDLREYNGPKNQQAVPFSPAFGPLLQILKSEEQHTMIKIAALRGIHRISTMGTLSQTERLDAAEQIVAELKDPKQFWWYQLRLVEALSRIDLTVDRNNRPFIIQILTEIVADRGRTWIVRSFAARGLGHTKIPANVNLNKVVYEIVQLSRDMVEAYNKQPNAPYWKLCFYNVYIAFHPLDPDERAASATVDYSKFGLLQNVGQYKPLIQSSYEQIAPLAKHILNGNAGNPFPVERTTQLDNWLKQNIPGNQSVAPNMPSINSSQARDPNSNTQ